MDRRISPRFFDDSKPLVWRKHLTVNGEAVAPGDAVSPKDFDKGQRMRLWLGQQAVYADAFIDSPGAVADADPITITEGKRGWFAVSAPWLDEPIKARGRDNAEAEAAALREAGEPEYHHGVSLTGGAGGWYSVDADWLEDVEKFHGHDAAISRAAELRKNPPQEWTDLSDDDKAARINAAGFSADDWRAIPEDEREAALLKAEADRAEVDADAEDAQDGDQN